MMLKEKRKKEEGDFPLSSPLLPRSNPHGNRHRYPSLSIHEESGDALTSAGFAVEALPALAGPGEDDDDGGAAALLLPLPAAATGAEVFVVPPVVRADAARFPSPPAAAPDDVAATMAAQGLAAAGTAGWSPDIPRKERGVEKEGLKRNRRRFFFDLEFQKRAKQVAKAPLPALCS